MSISLALILAALLLKVILFDKDYEQLMKTDVKSWKDIRLPTNYNDKDLLEKTLREFNAKHIKVDGENIICSIESYHLKFLKGKKNYIIELSGIKNPDRLIDELKCLDGLYKENLQQQVYVKTKERIQEQGMRIEAEEILEDNSIVLTVAV
ncbi:hypothetical protein [Luxibacter massiliensis]|uniref:hypothetical protein n=1 Tax=Luxibacter massiliensis TaxID=2219695 RepID=UPI000F05360F|nr:hypothetical protein [Luxibacter massiliensis]